MEEEKEQFNSEVPVKQKKSHPKAQLIVQRFSKKRKNNNKSSRWIFLRNKSKG